MPTDYDNNYGDAIDSIIACADRCGDARPEDASATHALIAIAHALLAVVDELRATRHGADQLDPTGGETS